jgi:thioredoxin reductase (NADPH)
VIVGSGPAGYTAAIYAARAMLEPILIQGIQPGGQLTITTRRRELSGLRRRHPGPWLMEQMQKQAEHVGTRIVTDHVMKVTLGQRPFRLECDSGDVYLADALIIATGAQARWLDLPSEQKFKGLWRLRLRHLRRLLLSQQGSAGDRRRQHRGRRSAVPHQFASKVTVVHRRDSFRAEKILQDRLFKNPKIS